LTIEWFAIAEISFNGHALKVTENHVVRQIIYNFLLMFNGKYTSVSHSLRDISTYFWTSSYVVCTWPRTTL